MSTDSQMNSRQAATVFGLVVAVLATIGVAAGWGGYQWAARREHAALDEASLHRWAANEQQIMSVVNFVLAVQQNQARQAGSTPPEPPRTAATSTTTTTAAPPPKK